MSIFYFQMCRLSKFYFQIDGNRVVSANGRIWQVELLNHAIWK